MATAPIVAYVKTVLADDDVRKAFDARIADLSSNDGVSRNSDDEAARAESYLFEVIDLIGQTLEAAEREKARHFAGPLMKVARRYFFHEDDLIPDHQGLFGLIDDAYLAHRFVLRLSEEVAADRGAPLLEDLKPELDAPIRTILGPEMVEALDARVEQDLKSILPRSKVAMLAMRTGTLPNVSMDSWQNIEEHESRMRTGSKA